MALPMTLGSRMSWTWVDETPPPQLCQAPRWQSYGSQLASGSSQDYMSLPTPLQLASGLSMVTHLSQQAGNDVVTKQQADGSTDTQDFLIDVIGDNQEGSVLWFAKKGMLRREAQVSVVLDPPLLAPLRSFWPFPPTLPSEEWSTGWTQEAVLAGWVVSRAPNNNIVSVHKGRVVAHFLSGSSRGGMWCMLWAHILKRVARGRLISDPMLATRDWRGGLTVILNNPEGMEDHIAQVRSWWQEERPCPVFDDVALEPPTKNSWTLIGLTSGETCLADCSPLLTGRLVSVIIVPFASMEVLDEPHIFEDIFQELKTNPALPEGLVTALTLKAWTYLHLLPITTMHPSIAAQPALFPSVGHGLVVHLHVKLQLMTSQQQAAFRQWVRSITRMAWCCDSHAQAHLGETLEQPTDSPSKLARDTFMTPQTPQPTMQDLDSVTPGGSAERCLFGDGTMERSPVQEP